MHPGSVIRGSRSFCAAALLFLSSFVLQAGESAFYNPLSPAIFVTPDVWPWGFTNDEGQPAGMLPRFTSRVAAIANVPVINELRPHRRATTELQSGETDFVVLFQSPVTDAAGVRVVNVVTVEILLAGVAGSRYPLTIDGLAGKSVGYIRGTYYGEAFERDREIVKVPVNSLEQAIEMLKLGRLDAMVASDQLFYHTLEAMKLAIDEFRTDTVINEQKAFLYMSRKAQNPQLFKAIRQAAVQMRENGELEEIFRLPE
ncbi:MAG: transporter substrate-binding domain-containing protein [Marinobacter sp.]|uniref:substrate-binding periplasmic protein n=1 Tax=Marinobacter sp. TaxID=50741 RepID=UPI0034A096D1